ncbi:MAG: ROK family protein [Thermomicrobiales bacterium]|nr:ROK family protein [Thermomicrobiales bacterium]
MARRSGDGVWAIGVDIGGTTTKAGLVGMDGSLRGLRRLPTPAAVDPAAFTDHLLALVRELADRQQVIGVGVTLASFVTVDGVIIETAHLSRSLIGYDLGSELRRAVTCPVYFALDVIAPTLGEFYFGAGRDTPYLTYVTVSTGIGAGSMVAGAYFTGGLGWAGGVGHTIIDETSDRICSGCGNAGCLETFAASQGIADTARELAARHRNSALARLEGADFTPSRIAAVAAAGDPAACEVYARVGHALGIGLTNLIDTMAPDVLIVGGGIAQAGELLLAPARAVVHQRAYPPSLRTTPIVPAALADLSGVYGAAAMALHDLRIDPLRGRQE